MTTPAAAQHGGVLTAVKAKPSGWPTASPDTGSGHHPSGSHPGPARDTITKNHVSTESGEPRSNASWNARVSSRSWSSSKAPTYFIRVLRGTVVMESRLMTLSWSSPLQAPTESRCVARGWCW
jgi:hypothetical protein